MKTAMALVLSLTAASAIAATNLQATANLYGAGKTNPPAPAGGGAGILPVIIPVTNLVDETLMIHSVTGTIYFGSYSSDIIPNPDGTGSHWGDTDLLSYEGISGIVCPKRVGFIAGVFLDDSVPSNPAPDRLAYTNDWSFDLPDYWPALRQSFYVGDGRNFFGTLQRFHAPTGSTRLALGFMDGYLAHGNPGEYGDNRQALTLSVFNAMSPTATTVIATAIEVGWLGQTNQIFLVQGTDNLPTGQWRTISAPIQGSGSYTSILQSIRNLPNQFYRVMRLDAN
jgi:hypothetical protein